MFLKPARNEPHSTCTSVVCDPRDAALRTPQRTGGRSISPTTAAPLMQEPECSATRDAEKRTAAAAAPPFCSAVDQDAARPRAPSLLPARRSSATAAASLSAPLASQVPQQPPQCLRDLEQDGRKHRAAEGLPCAAAARGQACPRGEERAHLVLPERRNRVVLCGEELPPSAVSRPGAVHPLGCPSSTQLPSSPLAGVVGLCALGARD